jgi:RNA polymerase sigma-70 factor (ECF subfamily)
MQDRPDEPSQDTSAKRLAARRESDAMRRVADQVGEVASEDARTVSDAREGDRQAFARLFEKYRGPAYHIAFRLLGRREDALDAVQEAFGRAFAALATFRGGASFKTWFFRIVTNCSLDLRRSRAIRQTASLDAEGAPATPDAKAGADQPWRSLERRELKERIDAALGAIPESNRTAFVLFAIEGVSYREIAEILNISIGTVMSRIFYARQKLQRILSGRESPSADDGRMMNED